jgi:glycosyltransferase involved in cell wall biosynthesis
MIGTLFGNFGIRNSVHNGQTQKTLQVAALLDQISQMPVERVDTSNLPVLCLKYAKALRSKGSIGLCLGPKGLLFVARLHRLLSPLLGRHGPAVLIFAVGGWLRELAERQPAVRHLCRNAKVLVETPGLQTELATLGISAVIFRNFRDLPVNGTAEKAEPLSLQVKLTYCGRISADKGYKEAIALAGHLVKNGNPATLQFYGPILDDDFRDDIAKYPFITYEGTYDDPVHGHAVMLGRHFLVLPSRYPGECVPGAVIEAKFAGVPAIVSDWRFLPEVVLEGKTGFVCGLNNFAAEATNKIIETTDDAFAAMSAACREEAQAVYSVTAAKAVLIDALAAG